jgi:hypothetical protein
MDGRYKSVFLFPLIFVFVCFFSLFLADKEGWGLHDVVLDGAGGRHKRNEGREG